MDQSMMQVIEKRILKTIASLERHNMAGYYAKTKEEAVALAESLMKPGETVTCGGTMTLGEIGMLPVPQIRQVQLPGPLCSRPDPGAGETDLPRRLLR